MVEVGALVGGCCSLATTLVTLGVAVGSFGLNIWNLVICSRAVGLSDACPQAHLLAFFIGSLVCSALSLLTGGVTIPVPHLVFAVLGQAWRIQAATFCAGAPSIPFLLATMKHSLFVLWFSFGSNAFMICLFGCICPVFMSLLSPST